MKRFISPLYQVHSLFLVVLLAGCSVLGVPKPETFNQRVAVGYATVTSVRQTALTLLEANKISPDDAQNVQTQADNARSGLDIARAIAATDPASADNRLQAVLVGLEALNAYLTSRSQK